MREWCLLNESGNVINMALSTKADGPSFPAPPGCRWEPIELVPQHKLESYQFWTERP